jgi:hypothetical protein
LALALVDRPGAAVVLALVDQASPIVYRGIIGECPVERDVGERTVVGLPGDDGGVSLARGDCAGRHACAVCRQASAASVCSPRSE